MIKTLRVKNYLSLRNLEIALGLRNAVVGPNNAGKSNIIEVFRLISAHPKTGDFRLFPLSPGGNLGLMFRRGTFPGGFVIKMLFLPDFGNFWTNHSSRSGKRVFWSPL
jgi:energy-coupling factor transporter ATP-binding protein EcfA2